MKTWKLRTLSTLLVLFAVQACADKQPQTSSKTHFQKCTETAECAKDDACIAELCRPIEIVSEEGAGSAASANGLSVKLDGQALSLRIDPGVNVRYLTCNLFEGMDKLDQARWVSVRRDLPGTYYQPVTFDGYMLDGEFVPPSGSVGCDLLECADLADGEDIGEATEYIATGTTMPPTDYVYRDPFVRPSMVGVYESQPLHASKVRTYVKYFTDTQCTDRHDVALEVSVP